MDEVVVVEERFFEDYLIIVNFLGGKFFFLGVFFLVGIVEYENWWR